MLKREWSFFLGLFFKCDISKFVQSKSITEWWFVSSSGYAVQTKQVSGSLICKKYKYIKIKGKQMQT